MIVIVESLYVTKNELLDKLFVLSLIVSLNGVFVTVHYTSLNVVIVIEH